MFFVISGFLITRLIRDEVAAGRFGFARFYARRARRLFPALFVTFLATLAGAWLLFVPPHFERFGGKLLHAALSVSNFYFWHEAGYFDAAAQVKPLLHTWSLSVEEQFYLLWPAFLVFLLRRGRVRTLLGLLAGGGLASLLLAEVLADGFFAFWLIPFRAFEFCIGALTVWLVRFRPGNTAWLDPVLLGGLALVVGSFVVFTPATPIPSTAALVPCLGAALVIYGGTARRAARLLNNRAAVGIGLISYSLYLVHWPMIVFWSYWRLEPPSDPERYALCALSAGLGWAMYRFVETPFRRPGGPARGAAVQPTRGLSPAGFGLGCALLTLPLVGVARAIWAQDGWPSRFPKLGYADYRTEKLLGEREAAALHAASVAAFPPGAGRNVLVIGDSHSRDVFGSLVANAALLPGHRFAQLQLNSGCYDLVSRPLTPLHGLLGRESVCAGMIRELRASPLVAAADVILIANFWRGGDEAKLPAALRHLAAESRARVVLLGQNAVFPYVLPALFREGPGEGLNRLLYRVRSAGALAANDRLRRIAAAGQVGFFDRQRIVCPPGEARCDVVAADGAVRYVDSHHWSPAGFRAYGRAMIAAGLLPAAGTGK